jgi:hypothetical protein
MYDVKVGEKRVHGDAPFLSLFLTKNGTRGTKRLTSSKGILLHTMGGNALES